MKYIKKIIATALFCINCIYFSIFAICDSFTIFGKFYGFTEHNAALFILGLFFTVAAYVAVIWAYGKNKKVIPLFALTPISLSQFWFTGFDSYMTYGKFYGIFVLLLAFEITYSVWLFLSER